MRMLFPFIGGEQKPRLGVTAAGAIWSWAEREELRRAGAFFLLECHRDIAICRQPHFVAFNFRHQS